MMQCFDRLAGHIKSWAGSRRIVYIPNPGNRGDGLIRYGTKMFLEDHGIAHDELTVYGRKGVAQLMLQLIGARQMPAILFGGGGAWSKAYSGSYRMVKELNRVTKNVLVLPSTFEFAPAGVTATLFRRDETESRKNAPESVFCHDLAFYPALKRDELGWWRHTPDHKPGVFFRLDRESNFAGNTPEGNEDVSASGNHMSNIDTFLRTVSARSHIVTDRLHVAVAGLICKRPVDLFGGNYFKIRAIHEASMDPFFTNEVQLRSGNHIELVRELREI